MQLPSTGTIFEQKYEILETLGAGGFATVFKARDVELGREVAIKILAPTEGDYPSNVVARFMVEARVIAQLRDAHTIRLFEFGNARGGLLYMVFQYVAGEDLSEVLKRTGPLPAETVVHVGRQVLSALAEAHEIGILHRDLKPGNVLVHEYMGDPFTTKLLDFGIAKVDEAVGGVSLTKTGALLGTPRYMSPEQVFAEPLGPTTDIYSLGLVLYEMLVGRPALEGSRKDVLKEHAAEKRHHLPPHIGWPALRTVIEKMLAHEPAARYQTAVEADQALAASVDNRGYEAGPPTLHSSGARHIPIGSSAEVPTYPMQTRPMSSSGVSHQSFSTSHAAYVVERDSRVLWAVAAVLVVVAVGVVGVLSQRDEPPPTTPTRAQPLPDDLLKGTSKTVAPEPVREIASTAADAGPDLAMEPVDLSPSPGCGTKHIRKNEYWIKTGARGGRVYLPNTYDHDKPHALIVAFGPKYESEGGFAKDSGLTEVTMRGRDAITVVVSPANRLDPWEENEVDVLATRAAIQVMKETYCIDPQRVFALGHHDGALFVRKIACEIPFAGIALSGFAEKLDRERCDLQPVVPTLLVAGLDDDFIPPDGGNGCTRNGPYAPIAEHEALWRDRYSCTGAGARLSKTKSSECTVWDSCDAPLALCRAQGGHHLAQSDWLLLYPTCSNRVLQFSLGKEAWRFFQKHGRPISETDPRFRFEQQ